MIPFSEYVPVNSGTRVLQGTRGTENEKFKQVWEWEGRRRKKGVGDKPKLKYFKILNGIYYFVR